MNDAVLLLARAFDFCAQKHTGQNRKGAAAEPYVNHPAEVARLLAEATAGDDHELIAAGLLHDTLEDTATTSQELASTFGPVVAGLVAEVTDDKTPDNNTRRQTQIEKTAKASRRAKMIKLADKTSNLNSIKLSPPADWDKSKKLEYAGFAKSVADVCRGASPFLEARFDAAYAAVTDG